MSTGKKSAGHQRRKEQSMTRFPTWKIPVRIGGRSVLAVGLAFGVAACSDTGEFMFGSRDAAAAGPTPIGAAPLAERDVEAPEVFDVTDAGLWDGRPSLGGVWVAHPDATDPERVLIRNTETGSFVIGALFRRERENPGPRFQISSDAAAALDILAGAPTELQVIALRREEVAPAEAPIAETAVEPILETEVASAPESASETDVPALAASALAVESAAVTAETDARPFLRPFAAAPAVVELPRNMSAADVMAGITRAAFNPDELAPPVQAARSPSIAAIADAAITETEITSAPLPPVEAAPVEVAAAAPVAAPPPAPEPVRVAAPAASELERAYVQIGIFSVQENANNTGQTLRNAGLVPTIYEQTSNGRRFWRVVVGPAPTMEDRAAVLDTVRGLGFGDAYFVSG
jgi:rare lipoprotein A